MSHSISRKRPHRGRIDQPAYCEELARIRNSGRHGLSEPEPVEIALSSSYSGLDVADGTLDSWMIYRIERTWQQTWIDRTVQTFSAGSVWELDSRRGDLRFLYLKNDWQYERATGPFHASAPLFVKESPGDGPENIGVAEWKPDTLLGFGIEQTPVGRWKFNEDPTSPSPPRIAYVVKAVYTPIWFWLVLFGIAPVWSVAGPGQICRAKASHSTRMGSMFARMKSAKRIRRVPSRSRPAAIALN